MDERQVVAYFMSAQDARRAMNALQAANAEVSDPQPVQPPEDGRSWRLVIIPSPDGMSRMFQDPILLDRVVGIILQFNGITTVNDSQMRDT